ncbi:sigma-70 family RNA polymerase sigma factor [Bordetella genomosp. 1]|uniref:RNA polymerase subunit sigma n=1 Tax=Bordetella genomosp. 1 TaxID=1395607 RepID=A0ABX4EZB7_9BORD|nr:sigma-70 family RNA polymerase sigma factor [Bordetella genomosp. 1]OZI65096.1 RNA polymerase subunit sigma [Bordetella genomosp. 1]
MQGPASTIASSAHRDVDRLYRDHHGWLAGWLRARLGNAGDAADLAHDTFVRVLQARRRAAADAPDGGSRAFLVHIAKGLMVDHWRRQAVERAYLEALAVLPEAVTPSVEARALILETLVRIDAALAALPARTREIFLLAQFDGLKYDAIADRMAVSLATVKRHMQAGFVACLAAA